MRNPDDKLKKHSFEENAIKHLKRKITFPLYNSPS